MNYKKLYFNIIRNRRNNPLPTDEYGEVHHIKPHSFGGLDTPNNLIRLSAREHFIVHFLLYKMYKHRVKNVFPRSEREKFLNIEMVFLHMEELEKLKRKNYLILLILIQIIIDYYKIQSFH